jgi:hypothetical protein
MQMIKNMSSGESLVVGVAIGIFIAFLANTVGRVPAAPRPYLTPTEAALSWRSVREIKGFAVSCPQTFEQPEVTCQVTFTSNPSGRLMTLPLLCSPQGCHE